MFDSRHILLDSAIKDDFNGSQWSAWSPRAELAPKLSRESEGATGVNALKVEIGEDASMIGGWQRSVSVSGGQTYRFLAECRARNVAHPHRSLIVELDWLNDAGRRVRPPDFAPIARREGERLHLEYQTTAPEDATLLRIQLGLAWSPRSDARWERVELIEEPKPDARKARLGTVNLRPGGMSSSGESVEQFCRLLERLEPGDADLLCLPEGISVVGSSLDYYTASEAVPGPTTERLGLTAKRLNAYIAAGIYERVGGMVYNTSVLIGREGELAGTYRKTHLPREEVEGGITPGEEYPVFKTDFGKVGMMICWDVQFPEPARALALKGAEVILLPIWGGSEVLAKARAIENHVYLVTSSYDMPCFIVDPEGKVRAQATEENRVAIIEVDLEEKIRQVWLGDMKPRTWKERRPDLPLGDFVV